MGVDMDYRSGEKTRSGYLALPPSGTGPGVLVLHAWWGLNKFFIGLCDRLAKEGYVTLAPDLYGGAVVSSVEEAEALAEGMDGEATGEQVLQALTALQQLPTVHGSKVGVLGCSLGAWWTLQISALRPEQVAASVLFYGVGEADFAAARCAYLAHFAENDVFDSLTEARRMEAAMGAAGRDVTSYVYPGVGHWFFEEDRPDAYEAEAARLAWDRTVAFLNGHLRDGYLRKGQGR